ncbi:MAG: pilin [Candidatus Uhrbacteria bacterium]|nr:pilin [Candidatus Uhrbacteria bacterium]
MKPILSSLFAFILALSPRLLFAATLYNPLDPDNTKTVTVSTIIGRLISTILGVTGSIALLMFVYGGFLWLISAGVPDRVKKGKEVMKWAVLGLVIIVGAYTIVRAIVSALESGTI